MNSFEKWRLLACRIDQIDEVAVRLDQLLREGKVSKDQIFSKYLSDTVAKFYNKQHTYDADVIEFYSTIMYLGGRRTFNFLRGSMFYDQGRVNNGNRDFDKIPMNLGGPSESLCLRQNTAFTCKSAILKSLNLLQLMVLSNDPNEGKKSLISNSKLIVFACCSNNDGTALKASVEFDPVTKRNIKLTVPVDLNFVKEHDPPDPKILKGLIVTEAIVSSITTLDYKVSLPVLVDYTTKADKTRENMKEMFTKHVKTLQMCKSCTEETKANDLIIEANPICESCCRNCYKNKELCSPCIEDGQISIFSSVRICKRCIAQGQQCIRRAVLVITSDCEEGNNQMFLSLKTKIETERIDPELSLTVPLLDAPHLGKNFKASFGNWILKLFYEREDAWLFFTL